MVTRILSCAKSSGSVERCIPEHVSVETVLLEILVDANVVLLRGVEIQCVEGSVVDHGQRAGDVVSARCSATGVCRGIGGAEELGGSFAHRCGNHVRDRIFG